MIPSTNQLLTQELRVQVQPAQTYQLLRDEGRIRGLTDGLEAVAQSVWKILNTERFQYVIYSWNYGVELLDLYGRDRAYVCAELERRIREALKTDDRVLGCDRFTFDTARRHEVLCRFRVNTIYGEIQAERAVEVQ